jgi:putative RNA 2'-phosphotransferase
MDRKTTINLSKFLSLVLRHKPDTIGITLDPSGWIDVDTLLAAMTAHGKKLSREDLQEIVVTSDKQRFALSEDGRRIRANQGHSVEVELGYAPAIPPEVLYHGTAVKYLDSIRTGGVVKGKRHDVHLSATIDTATAVGQRHGTLVMLRIDAAAMHRAGHEFFLTPNGVWLTDTVPVGFFEVVNAP